MWYLNDTNTEIVALSEVQVGDIITRNLNFDHGRKVSYISTRRRFGMIWVEFGTGSREVTEDKNVRRLLMNPDGTVQRAEMFVRSNGRTE